MSYAKGTTLLSNPKPMFSMTRDLLQGSAGSAHTVKWRTKRDEGEVMILQLRAKLSGRFHPGFSIHLSPPMWARRHSFTFLRL